MINFQKPLRLTVPNTSTKITNTTYIHYILIHMCLIYILKNVFGTYIFFIKFNFTLSIFKLIDLIFNFKNM